MIEVRVKYQFDKPKFATVKIDPNKTIYDLKRLVFAKFSPDFCYTQDAHVIVIEYDDKNVGRSKYMDPEDKLLSPDKAGTYDMSTWFPRGTMYGDTDKIFVKYNEKTFEFNFNPRAVVGRALYDICDKIFAETGEELYPWDHELYEPIDDIVLYPGSSLGEYKNVARACIYFKTDDIYKPGPICDLIAKHQYYQLINLGSKVKNATVILRPKTIDFTNIKHDRNCYECGSSKELTYMSPKYRKYYCEKCLK